MFFVTTDEKDQMALSSIENLRLGYYGWLLAAIANADLVVTRTILMSSEQGSLVYLPSIITSVFLTGYCSYRAGNSRKKIKNFDNKI